MKEMVGGCCVCSDERGWAENPLVYCDGEGCCVAVHQACYGIVLVPAGNWYCRKCELIKERPAKVRCDLCPNKDGAFKKTDSGTWAHVVCALYIPEVRFENVTTMEPILTSLIPSERFNRTCYICERDGRSGAKATFGATMECNKVGCRIRFHVTCAQAHGLLCEEAGNLGLEADNVKYCGYCSYHSSKLKKTQGLKIIPPFKPEGNNTPSESSPTSSPEKTMAGPGPAANPKGPNISPDITSATGSKKYVAGKSSSTSSTATASVTRNLFSEPQGTSSSSSPSKLSASVAPLAPPDIKPHVTLTPIPMDTDDSPKQKESPGQSGHGATKRNSRGELSRWTFERDPLDSDTDSAPEESSIPPGSGPGVIMATSPYFNPLLPLPLATHGNPNPYPNGTPTRYRSTSNPNDEKYAYNPNYNYHHHPHQVSRHSHGHGHVHTPHNHTHHHTHHHSQSHQFHHGSVPPYINRESSAGASPIRRRGRRGSTGTNRGNEAGPDLEPSPLPILPISLLPPPPQAQNLPPHMFGNTLNPASSMAQQMVDSLSQEMKTITENSHSGDQQQPSRSSSAAAPGPATESAGIGIAFPGKKPAVPQLAKGQAEPSSSSSHNPQTLEDLLERQWEQGSQFLMEQAAHLDIAQLLSCLNQLKQDNRAMEEHVASLAQRKEQLAAINARLSVPFAFNNSNFVPGMNRTQPQPQPYNPPPVSQPPHQEQPRVVINPQRFHELQQQHQHNGPSASPAYQQQQHQLHHGSPSSTVGSSRPSSTNQQMNGPTPQQQAHYNRNTPQQQQQR